MQCQVNSTIFSGLPARIVKNHGQAFIVKQLLVAPSLSSFMDDLHISKGRNGTRQNRLHKDNLKGRFPLKDKVL